MQAVIDYIFAVSGFMPHGYCLLAQPGLITLHAASDAVIAAAYFSIPLVLLIFQRRRADLHFRPVFICFAMFILACGLTHVMGVVTLWYPAYPAEGVIKAATAIASLATAVLIWRVLPAALALPSPAMLRQANLYLEAEIHRREGLEAQLRELADTDGVTAVANRRHFDRALETEWRRAAREGVPIALLVFDVDRFKGFNDRHGHPAGDICLRAVAGAAGLAIRRPGDFLARIGGDEFAVILPATDLPGAQDVAQRILAAIKALALPPGTERCGDVTVSLGAAATVPGRKTVADPDALLVLADRALYQAKQQGRDQVVCSAEPRPSVA